MILEKFTPSEKDNWTWNKAGLLDVLDIVSMAEMYFEKEIQNVLSFSADMYAHNLTLAIVNQSFDPAKCLIITARNKETNKLVGFAWLNRGIYMPYAKEEIAEGAFIHMDMSLGVRPRTTITAQILQQWELWCQVNHIPVLASGTIRADQEGFLNLHKAAGFDIRGSIAYKKIL